MVYDTRSTDMSRTEYRCPRGTSSGLCNCVLVTSLQRTFCLMGFVECHAKRHVVYCACGPYAFV